jgi:hypothetical protein
MDKLKKFLNIKFWFKYQKLYESKRNSWIILREINISKANNLKEVYYETLIERFEY